MTNRSPWMTADARTRTRLGIAQTVTTEARPSRLGPIMFCVFVTLALIVAALVASSSSATDTSDVMTSTSRVACWPLRGGA